MLEEKEYKMNIPTVCEICGKEYIAHSARGKYCSRECKEVAHAENKRLGYPKSKTKNRKKKESGLNAAITEANKLGISYGKYKAMQYIKNTKDL